MRAGLLRVCILEIDVTLKRLSDLRLTVKFFIEAFDYGERSITLLSRSV